MDTYNDDLIQIHLIFVIITTCASYFESRTKIAQKAESKRSKELRDSSEKAKEYEAPTDPQHADHEHFVNMRATLFDWLKAPLTSNGENLAQTKVARDAPMTKV